MSPCMEPRVSRGETLEEQLIVHELREAAVGEAFEAGGAGAVRHPRHQDVARLNW